jgi:RNA polymerase sigma-70 factor (ECF subfamily)
MPPRDPDHDLVQKLKRRSVSERGDLFEPLYQRHAATIHALCLRRTRNCEDALDALQETFVTAAMQIERFRGASLFSTWLHRIALNKCGEILRRRRRRLRLEQPPPYEQRDESTFEAVADEAPSPFDRAGENELNGRVRQAVEDLPCWLRRAVQMRYFDHLAYEEIAAAMSVPVGTVKSRLFRAHRTLARELGSWVRSA